MKRAVSVLIMCLLPGGLVLTPCNAGAETVPAAAPPEVGYVEPSATGEDEPFPDLKSANPVLDVSALYTRFTGDGMNSEYGGLPAVSAGLTFQFSRYSYFWMSLGYGASRGNSLAGITGFSGPDDLTVRAVPFQLGLKFDGAHSERVRFYLGAALEFAWMQETLPALAAGGHVEDRTASEINTGFALVCGPEFLLGDGDRAFGLEIGWGGAKGSVRGDDSSHDVDLTGVRGRIYYALAL